MTQQAKHTPGPWKTLEGTVSNNDRARDELWGGVEGDGWIIADIVADVEELKNSAPANARLIAAAPELLAVCQAIEAHCRVETPETRSNPLAHAAEGKALRERMRAAIAKAEGRT